MCQSYTLISIKKKEEKKQTATEKTEKERGPCAKVTTQHKWERENE